MLVLVLVFVVYVRASPRRARLDDLVHAPGGDLFASTLKRFQMIELAHSTSREITISPLRRLRAMRARVSSQ